MLVSYVFSPERPCPWMGNGYETRILCTGESYYRLSQEIVIEYSFQHFKRDIFALKRLFGMRCVINEINVVFRVIELKKWELLIVNLLFTRGYKLLVGVVMVQPRYFPPLRIFSSYFLSFVLVCCGSFASRNNNFPHFSQVSSLKKTTKVKNLVLRHLDSTSTEAINLFHKLSVF